MTKLSQEVQAPAVRDQLLPVGSTAAAQLQTFACVDEACKLGEKKKKNLSTPGLEFLLRGAVWRGVFEANSSPVPVGTPH